MAADAAVSFGLLVVDKRTKAAPRRPRRTDPYEQRRDVLCRFHHRLLHHHGWQLLIPNGHWVAIDPHGTHWTGKPTPTPTTRGDPP